MATTQTSPNSSSAMMQQLPLFDKAPAVHTDADVKDRVMKAVSKFDRSRSWMQNNFWGQWEMVLRQYLCEPAEIIDPNDVGATAHSTDQSRYRGLFGPSGKMIDETVPKTGDEVVNLYVPDQWALVRRKTARVTAQVPNLRMRNNDFVRANKVSRTIMWQWDNMGRAREEKKHTACAFLFGWSVKAWYWVRNVYKRTTRIDPLNADPEMWKRIMAVYGKELQPIVMMAQQVGQDPTQLMAMYLLDKYGVGKYIRLREDALGYVGPRFDHIFLPYLFPQPNFTSIQDSSWFAVVRRRTASWFENLAAAYEGDENLNTEQLNEVRTNLKNGTKAEDFLGQDGQSLLRKMTNAVDRSLATDGPGGFSDSDDAEWSVLEIHHKGTDGENATVEYIVEGRYYLGRLPYTFDLEEGKKAFTEKVFVDSFLGGVGDSASRIIRQLVEQHGRETSMRHELASEVLRPYMITDDQNLIDEPSRIKRGPYGMRIITVQGKLQPVMEPHAHAAIMTGLQNDNSIGRNIQYATGESNMSSMADVDPQQARTATGARIMAFNQDTLSKEELQMHNVAVTDDANMMRMLDRSELSDELTFDQSPYARETLDPKMAAEQQAQGIGFDALTTVTPEDFQTDGMMTSEVGSTLADDDELNVHKAQIMLDAALRAPQLLNPNRARDSFVISMGEGARLNEWRPQAPTGPVEPPPADARMNFNMVVNYKDVAEVDPELAKTMLMKAMEEREPRDPNTGAPVGEGGGGGAPGSSNQLSPPNPGMSTGMPGTEGPNSAYEAGVGAPVPEGGGSAGR